MTPKIARFLADQQPATPCLVVDLSIVAEQYQALHNALPTGRIHYAVKANPASAILTCLHQLGSYFDIASPGEIDLCLQAGIPAAKLSFGHTVKTARSIAYAHQKGLTLFAFDCLEELEKLAQHAPGCSVFCRLGVLNTGAEWPLSRKFGTTVEHAFTLLTKAHALGLKPAGLSFHVGSQQTHIEAYAEAIAQAAELYHRLDKEQNITLDFINMGGGFPTYYRTPIPAIDQFGQAITTAMQTHFPRHAPQILLEPGRYMVGSAGIVQTEVVLASHRGNREDEPRWVYLDIGRFGGLAETEGEAIRYAFQTPYDKTSTHYSPCILAGPSCDSMDVLYEKNPVPLPDELKTGDKLIILSTGAYVSTYCSTGFNGFPPLKEYYL
ncbi:type III PLP-dependent enzyme [Bombella sp. ESL0385]|uniref:type III PLP-dependent enzyme n=1 Tax=Bombella sp. ESL0385 TaxID=2676446 RepID=UPI0012D8D87D|nr:type III PLP-dependent enzyme [Bombella sp. ESL0385]MUG89706.1 type III PLP-dependent enzyme [Bombella sp. ESL0385]